MFKKHIRKILAGMLTLIMVLTCLAASASTVDVSISVDREAVSRILAGFGIPEEQMGLVSPVLSLINALGVRVISAEDGAQVDLNLDGEPALSLGYAVDEQQIRLASTLFPNYVLNLKQETMGQLTETFMSNMPAFGTAGDEEGMMSILPTSPATYFSSFMQVCAEAAVPGEPVKGEYQFDGYNFDTMVPVNVDVPKIREAFHGLAEDMLKDEAVLSSLGSYAQMSGKELDPEELKAELAEFEAHFPDTATAEYYQNDGQNDSFYLAGRSGREGKEAQSYEYTMLRKDEKNYTMTFLDHEQGSIVGVILTDGGVRIEYTQGEMNFILEFTTEAGEATVYRCRIFFMDTDKPLISAQVTVSEDGVRTLSMDGEGKTALALEDLMSGEGDAAGGLLTDIMLNGAGPLMVRLSEAAPEAAQLIASLMMQQSGQQTAEEPEEEPQVVADPSSWKTLADVLALKTESRETSWIDGKYLLFFRYAGTQWMVEADVSKEQWDAAFEVDYFAEDRDEQIAAILGACEIRKVLDLGTFALPQEELDQWIGKTGQDLLDAGWEYNGYHSEKGAIRACMVNGEFEYLVAFAEELITSNVFGEQPENMTAATISGLTFNGKSFHFDETDYLK